MALQQKPGGYASMTVPKKSKPAVKKPPAPPPRKSSVPTALTSSDVKSFEQKVLAAIPKLKQNAEPSGSTMLHVPPPYAVLVPATPETVNSSAFPSRQPTACLARTQSCDQGVQFDIHGDAIIGQMKPIPVSAPQAPPTAPKEGDDLTPRKTSASVSLKHLADYYFPKFPLRIQFLEGYMSNHVPHLTFSTADIYNIHLLKRQEVVVAKDTLGHQYNIPLNTAIQFSLLPSSEVLQSCCNNSQGSNILNFDRVSDIIAMKVPPAVICATRSIRGGEKESVDAGEILVIDKVSKHKKKKVIEVFSVTKKVQKVLSSDCSGHFTTSPRQIALHLPDLLEHVPNVLPCEVLLYFNDYCTNGKSNFSSTSLSNGVILLTERKVETSLVASTIVDDDDFDLGNEDCLLDIPLDKNLSEIEVAIVGSSNTYTRKRLQTATQNILKNVDLSKLRSYRDAASDNIYATQAMLYSTQNDRLGVEFETPVGLNQESSSTQSVNASELKVYDTIPNEEAKGDQMYETIQPVTSLSTEWFTSNLNVHPRARVIKDGFYQTPRSHPAGHDQNNYDAPRVSKSNSETRLSSSSAKMQHLQVRRQWSPFHTSSVPSKDNTMVSRSVDDLLAYEDMQSVRNSDILQSIPGDDSEYEVFSICPPHVDHQSVTILSQKVHKMQEENELLREKVALEQAKLTVSLKKAVDRVEHLEKEMKSCMELIRNSVDKAKDALTDEKQNRELLKRATSDQILEVLDSMGLHQYKDAFSQESVDGAVLLELDEEVLTSELGVKSKIHCVKLMKLISGESSIQKFLLHCNT